MNVMRGKICIMTRQLLRLEREQSPIFKLYKEEKFAKFILCNFIENSLYLRLRFSYISAAKWYLLKILIIKLHPEFEELLFMFFFPCAGGIIR